MEDHLYFIGLFGRFKQLDYKFLSEKMFANMAWPKILKPLIIKTLKRRMINQCYAQGIGRHTSEEIMDMGIKDLEALSVFLADKPYLLGSQPSEVDCVLFGVITVILYGLPEDFYLRKAIEERFCNLKRHQERIKENYWPDWDECVFNKDT